MNDHHHPCPFCGAHNQFTVDARKLAEMLTPWLVVVCPCGSNGPGGHTEDEAWAAWNRRAAA